MDHQVGQPADLAPSAYRYRSDRTAGENPPESWLALLHYAGIPLNQTVDTGARAIREVLCGLLWEEMRPVRTLELSWPDKTARRPVPAGLTVTTLVAQTPASSWWNNLRAMRLEAQPTVSADGATWLYPLEQETCGIVVAVTGGGEAAAYDVPVVRALASETWKTLDVEIEWGFDEENKRKDYSGRVEAYDGRLGGLRPLDGDTHTTLVDADGWRSPGDGGPCRGVAFRLLYIGTSARRAVQPFTSQREDVARTIVTLWTRAGNFSFRAADLEHGPILAPEYGFFVRAAQAPSAAEYLRELESRKLATVRRQVRAREEQTWEAAVTAMHGPDLPPHPAPPAGTEPAMQVVVPSERLTAQWALGAWHLVRHCEKHPDNGRLWFNDHPYGILGAETYLILAALDLLGLHQAAEDGFDQWLSLPLDPDSTGHHEGALPDRPNGLFADGHGCLTHAVGVPGWGGHMDGVHAFGPGSIGWALTEHYWLTGDREWLRAAAPRIEANAEWMARQRRLMARVLPGGDRLWCKGLQPALQVTPDSGGLWMQFYECEAYYWLFLSRFAQTLAVVDAEAGARWAAEAEAWRRDLLAAVERSIALSPVVAVRDGTYHSVIPFACYVRGLATGAWGWQRDGSGAHAGPLYWDTVQSAAALVSPAGLLSPDDVRVQGYLDVLEDRLLLENENVGERDWFSAGWQYQIGLERTANLHLAGDDVPAFLRSFLNGYAVDIVPGSGYVFNEHTTRGPEDKIFEEAAFLERFRNLLVLEEGPTLWLARATPRRWLEQGQRISVKNAPTHFGTVNYEIVSDVDHGGIGATVTLPSRSPAKRVVLRLRHPRGAPIQRATVNGAEWKVVDRTREAVILRDVTGTVRVEATYGA